MVTLLNTIKHGLFKLLIKLTGVVLFKKEDNNFYDEKLIVDSIEMKIVLGKTVKFIVYDYIVEDIVYDLKGIRHVVNECYLVKMVVEDSDFNDLYKFNNLKLITRKNCLLFRIDKSYMSPLLIEIYIDYLHYVMKK